VSRRRRRAAEKAARSGPPASPSADPHSALPRPTPSLSERAFEPVDIASLAVFRIAFGAVMAWEVVRYFQHGWIASYYIDPQFHFTYFGFGWVKPWPGEGMYVHFVVLGLAALGMMLGLFYRVSAVVFLVGFVYVFLLDQAFYLNHFYLIALLAFVLVLVPVHRALSLDARRRPKLRSDVAPAWALWLVRAQVGIPYLYGGIAKLNADWLRGEPIGTWVAEREDFPLIGPLLTHEWAGLAFAYGGLLLDLTIVPILLWRRTRTWAFAVALVFHALNATLFRIGIFPWLMIAATSIFFEPDWPRRWGLLPQRLDPGPDSPRPMTPVRARLVLGGLAAYLAVQALVPLRHFAYPGDVSWTEEGHLFSWHMKLRDKEATVRLAVRDPDTGEGWTVRPRDLLSRRQANKMAGHPDMILQFAHYLAERGRRDGRPRLQVRALTSASVNGREEQMLVDPDTDLAAEPRTLAAAAWILPLHQPLRPAARTVREADADGEE
jgi:vitamin K-dependent gamma-carboxylase